MNIWNTTKILSAGVVLGVSAVMGHFHLLSSTESTFVAKSPVAESTTAYAGEALAAAGIQYWQPMDLKVNPTGTSDKEADKAANVEQTSQKNTSPIQKDTVNVTKNIPVALRSRTTSETPQSQQTKTNGYNTQSGSTSPTGQGDLYWLAHLIEAEAGGEPYAAQVAVGEVVLNRVHSPEYPNTVKGVIFQRVDGVYAFSCVPNGFIYHEPSAQAFAAAKAVLAGDGHNVPNALVFYNASQTSATNWVRQRPVSRVIGHLTFAL